MQVSDRNKNSRSIITLAVICFILQIALTPQVSFGGGVINFALIFSAAIALKYGGKTGVMCGFMAGLIYDLTSTNPLGLMALLLVVSSYVLGQEVRDRISGNFGVSIGLVALQTFVVTFVYQLINSLIGTGGNFFEGLIFKSFPTMLITILAALPVFYMLSHSQRSRASLGSTAYRGSHRAPKRFK